MLQLRSSALALFFVCISLWCGYSPVVFAANTPPLVDSSGNLKMAPGPDGVTLMPANPALQADGIMVPDVFGSTPNWNLTPPLRKFVDSLAPLGCSTPNNLGQCIPIAVPDTLTFPGSDYYEIELQRFTEKVHTDLANPTTFQGYKQVNNGTNAAGTSNNVVPPAIHYLGPLILTQKGRPVRIKFVNKLPLESVSPLFIPVDKTVMGAGMGPKNANGTDCDPVWDPRGRNGLPTTEPHCAEYTTNRAELHLHGGLNPWISDGTPHQWITPAGETTPYKKADNVQYVPDMWFNAAGTVIASCAGQLTCGVNGASINPGDGAQTYYYTNDQSARLMFYHDHSSGITRLNVYAGEAAGYMIQDPTELDLIARNVIPADQIPLVIQDKAFVDPSTIGTLDPTWVWGTGPVLPVKWLDATGGVIASCAGQATCNVAGARKVIGRTPKAGDLWWPHVYLPAENPSALGGVNPMGRWVYGLYFWPPTTGIKFLPVTNPYYDCDPLGVCNAPWEPPTMPAAPNPSWTAEAFVDTPMVNGTVYPKLTVQPKPYRLRILNAAHDRFFNLQLYEADTTVNPNVVNATACAAMGGCATNTEVKMVPAIKYPAFPLWDAAADQRTGGVPDPATAGPPWIQIGNEGGFLPSPVVIPSQPISFVLDPTLFNVGNVNDGSLIMGPAERADVIVDFSQYAGKTLILYNDAPAAFPAFVPNNDYYTDDPDNSGAGGHPGTKAGIGPNTRTIMQINVAAAAPAPAYNLNNLISEFTSTPTQDSVFKKSQHPTIVGQSAYDAAYNIVFPAIAPFWGIANIGDQNISFESLNPTTMAPEIVNLYPMQPKALHDEMGAVWDEYGRMSAKLGVELPNTNNINQIFVMQNYVDPPTENVQDGKVQLWKLTHNGVDTHPLHFHLFDVQVINRVGWDGFVRLPWPNELGWKETVRVSPLEDTIVALRPKAPPVPFPLQDSVRLRNPAYLPGATDGFMNLDPLTGQAKVPADTNIVANYGAEYVWHCHILSHEEQDMMRPLVLRIATGAPADPTGLSVVAGFQKNSLSWTDNSYNGTVQNPYNLTLGFYIDRCDGTCDANNGTFSRIADMSMISSANPNYVDDSVASGATYTYRVTGYNRYTTNGAANGSWVNGLSAPAYSSAVTSNTWAPATTLSLVPDFASPHDAPVKFVALAGGTTVQPQYRFSVKLSTAPNSSYAVVQNYGVTRYWVMPAGTVPATYTIKVDARTNYASAVPDVTTTIPYQLLPTIDITPPITTAIPAGGDFINPVQVYLQVNEANSVTRYTIDGSTPTATNGTVYTGPISISTTTTLKYFSTDPAGNAEVVQTGQYNLLPMNLNASVSINGGAAVTATTNVTLTISATGATKMRFSNDGITYTADENFATTRAWTLAPATPDGQRFVYVRFTASNGVLQSPVTASITLDTTAPVTTASPSAPATFISPVTVALTANEPGVTTRYTTDGSNPITSPTAKIYTTAIPIAVTTQLNYYSTDPAGNMEAIKSGIYTIHTGDLNVQTFTINGGATLTNNPNVTLAIAATDATSVVKMRFSNDGVTYSADEPYATAKNWTLSAGDGVKTVFVRFTDGAGILYNPVTAQISLHTVPPVVTPTPPPGTFVNSVNIYLTSDEPGSTIKYTFDGTDPRTSATAATYTGPFNVNATTSLRYSATDPAGNISTPVTALYTITTANIAASVVINNGATLTKSQLVTLTVSATGVAMMSFSNDGINYSVAEPYATTKNWMLDPVDGIKAVFVRFTDAAGQVYAPVTSQITLDTTIPVTTANPPSGAFVSSINVYLTANEAGSIIKYTADGSDPATSATAAVYSGPITVSSTATLRYFATDQAGNAETTKSSSYTITSSVIAATLSINGGATLTNNQNVSLAISASGVDKMSFSNDGITYSTQEAYATSKTWQLSAGDGNKTIFVKFFDTVHNLAYDPITAQIALDTTKPVSTALPAGGTFISLVNVSLTANEPGSIIRYTTDGSDPSISATALVYSAPITISATTTLRYFATDLAGNAETPVSDTYTITSSVISASVIINGGATVTANQNVNLTIAAAGVDKMSFSNNGVTYSAQEAYATSKVWSLNPGDGVKNVYVKFFNTAQNIAYDPVTAQITLDTTKPVTTPLPAPATFISGVTVTLATNEPGCVIKYTTDGSAPTTSATAVTYNGSISLNTTTPIRYFATDPAGNSETPKTGLYTITSSVLVSSVAINGGAAYTNSPNVSLSIAANGVNMMSFSNNGVTYSAQETYATNKAWALSSGDGVKTVYIKFFDTTNNISYDPVIAQVILDTAAPITTTTPAAGVFINAVSVALSASEPGSTTRYTLDGSDPATSATAATYSTPLNITATTSVRYFSVDAAGNAEAAKSGTYTINSSTINASVVINGGTTITKNGTVNLAISATGVNKMSFSNDGITYTVPEAYAATKTWTVSAGDGAKTVFVRLQNSTNNPVLTYDPVTAQIILDTTAPVTAVTPVPGTFISQASVTLFANEGGSTIKYTLDGSDPATSGTAAVYGTPVPVTSTKTIRYFATDIAGNVEATKSGTYTIISSTINASVAINGGASVTGNSTVNLALSANGVDKMSFSNDGITYSTPETYTTVKSWQLPAGDGVKTVFVRFQNSANNPVLTYDPVTAQISLDTTAPVTSVTPAPAVFLSQVSVTLTANEQGSTIRYTLDNSDPTTSATAVTYTAPISISATTTVRYFSSDAAGNAEPVKSGTYTIHTGDLTVDNFTINNGAATTTTPNVNLSITASDAMGVISMRFSNDGVNYSADEPYATGKSWTLAAGEGVKTVFVRFTDGADRLYDPVTAQIILDTVAPATSITPAPGVFISAVTASLTANEPSSTITYTLDGSDPVTSATALTYSAPITVNSTATIKYFARDVAGNAEAVKSGTYTIHTGDLTVNSFQTNNGAAATNTSSVTLAISASDEFGVSKMRFSNDGISYTADEPYATSKSWTLSSGDGVKTVYAQFTDGAGRLYDPVTTQIKLDTLPATTTTSPQSGFSSMTPFPVTLTATDGSGSGISSIVYTTDGSDPLTSATAMTYSSPIAVDYNTVLTIRYFATDNAGNKESVKTATFKVTHVEDMAASVTINGGNSVTIDQSVTLNISASDSVGVASMSFSNDGSSYSAYETYATTKAWMLPVGEGQKTVYVKFLDTVGNSYGPYTAQITLAFKNGLLPGTTSQLASAMRALQIAKGNITATNVDLAHADVAPYVNGVPQPDGKIDLLDVYVLLLHLVGAVEL